ncbi:MAG: GvpL/GvpF family gas vesicle protein [Chloroflexaceae bacterium]
MTVTRAVTGRYLYGVIPCGDVRSFEVQGIHEQGREVYTIPYQELAVVVSDSPYEPYESTRRHMLAHTRVLEALMREYSVLPIRFGIVAPDADTVREQLLARHYSHLYAQLDELRNRIELGLKVFWTAEDMLRRIADNTPAIKALRDSLSGRSLESTYYERIRLGEMVEQALTARRAQDAEMFLAALRPLAVESVTLPVHADRMVLNAAFLVERQREAEFDEVVRRFGERFKDQFLFKYVGPVPPYNFVSITIQWQ